MNHRVETCGIALISLSAFALAAPAVAAPPGIADLAPDNTVIVAGSRNVERAYERLQRTGYWSLWESDEMREFREEMMKELETGLEEMSSELDLEPDAIGWPQGEWASLSSP